MPEQDPQEPHLKVSDRRKFTTSGDRRPGVEIDEEPSPAPTPAPVAAAPAAPPAPEPAKPTTPPPAYERLARREVGFAGLLEELYGTALIHLGLAAPPGEQPRLELEAAREAIDLIGMLQTKTHGNLTPEESQMLAGVLYELRMAYLEVAKAAAGVRPPAQSQRR